MFSRFCLSFVLLLFQNLSNRPILKSRGSVSLSNHSCCFILKPQLQTNSYLGRVGALFIFLLLLGALGCNRSTLLSRLHLPIFTFALQQNLNNKPDRHVGGSAVTFVHLSTKLEGQHIFKDQRTAPGKRISQRFPGIPLGSDCILLTLLARHIPKGQTMASGGGSRQSVSGTSHLPSSGRSRCGWRGGARLA